MITKTVQLLDFANNKSQAVSMARLDNFGCSKVDDRAISSASNFPRKPKIALEEASPFFSYVSVA